MDPHFPTSTRFNAKADGGVPHLHDLLRDEHHRLPDQPRSPGLPLIGAILALLAMLLVFHYVVRGSLQQSELRHKAVAVHAQAIWRCNNLQGREVSGTCLVQASAEARRVALLNYQNTP